MLAVRLASLGLLAMSIDAFVLPGRHHLPSDIGHRHQNQRAITTLQMGGFGGGGKAKNKSKDNKGPAAKLKPRKQWDRYISDDLKSSDSIRVAVRVVSSSDASKWYPVGDIKSKDNAHTEAAVIRHRMLIAEHARRMFPAEIIPSDKLEWGYCPTAADAATDDDCEWTIARKVDEMPPDIDKLIGFMGLPDLTGFYSSVKGSSSSNIAPGTNSASTSQSDYGSMKNKKITGHSRLEVHD